MDEKHKRKPGEPGRNYFIPIAGQVDRVCRKRSKANPFFIRAIVADFDANGAAALARARKKYPATYLKLAAAFLPVDPAELGPAGDGRCPLCGGRRDEAERAG